ncbi:restriction system protein [Xanthomonas sp. JAI131]|nr:restriction endonuclease [Xanthomonas sp. JAI131]NYF22408.1 restriction system protein [Xanthomonas sp. JAI131]
MSALAALPWPLGLAAGIAGFLVVRYGLAWWLSRHGGMLAQGIAQHPDSTLGPFAWIVLIVCWTAALFSFLGARHRRRLLDTRTTLESLADGGWRQFELLVGEAFRRQGYSVEENGLGGADGGIDLILRKDGRRTLVQCKQWKRQQVGVSVVREMYGLLAHHQAHAVKIVCIGSYTNYAARFAQGKPIELIGGERLLGMIQAAQREGVAWPSLKLRIEPALVAAVDAAAQTPTCRQCGSALIQRANRRTDEAFLGYSQFPRCRGTG